MPRTSIASRQLEYRDVVSPSQITADQIDYAISADATVLRLSTDAPRVIRSLAGGTAGRFLIVANIGAQPIILADEDLLGTAANRFGLNADIILFPDQIVNLFYDSISARWRSPNAPKTWERTVEWSANGNTTVISLQDCAAFTTIGTATVAAPAATALGQLRRLEYLVTAAATTNIASFRAPAALWWRGNAANLGGFELNMQWAPATGGTNTSQRAFAGFAAGVAAPTDVEPSSILNIVGMGWDAADANVQILSNDGTGAATKINLGASFAVPVVDRGAFYALKLLALPNASSIFYKVVDLLTGAIATGEIITDLPVSNTFLAPRAWVSVGGVSALVGITFSQCTVSSSY